MILFRYIIKEHIFPFLSSLSVIVFLFVMQQAVYLLEKIVSKGLDPAIVFELFVIQLGWIIALAVPMSILVSTLMTFGRMSGDNEITSIKASGQNMLSLMVPVFSAAAVMAVLLVIFNNEILPESNHRTANLLSDISRKRPAAFIEPGILIHDFSGYTIHTKDVDAKSGLMKGVKIFSDLPNQDPSVTIADSGLIRMTPDQQFLELTLFDGESHSIPRNNTKDAYFIGRFKKQIVSIKNVDSKFERTNSHYRSDREKSTEMMLTDVRELKESNKQYTKEFQTELDTFIKGIQRLDSVSLKYQASFRDVPDSLTFHKWASGIEAVKTTSIAYLQNRGESFDRIFRRIRSNSLMINQYLVEVHKKYAIPFACLIFVLIGAPLGIMARRGGLAVGASYSLLFFIIYWAFLLVGEAKADKMQISAFAAMWTGNILIGICGIILIILMLRETTIRFDWLITPWKKLFPKHQIKVSRPAILFRLPSLLLRTPRYIIRRFIGILPTHLIGIFSGYVIGLQFSIVVLFVVVDYVSNMKGRYEGVPYENITLYYWYYLPWICQITIPIVLLLSSMFAIGKMVRGSELTAIKASGMSVRQLTLPLLFLGLVFSVLTFYGGEKILPHANLLRREIEDNFRVPIAAAKKKGDGIKEYRRDFYYFGNQKTLYKFNEFSTSPFYANQVVCHHFDKNRIVKKIKADNMIYDPASGWKFINAEVRDFKTESPLITNKDTLKDYILTATPVQMVAKIKHKEEMSYWEMKRYLDAARNRGEKIDKYLGELDFKVALPFMNFIVILLGISITARAGRKGSAMLFGVGIALAFLYWILSRFSIVFAQNGHMPILLGAWLGNILFLFIGLILYRKASR
jgi:lipopolysaccharide export system permease protein